MTLLDVSGYGLFNDADVFLATAGKVLLTGAGVVLGAIVLGIGLIIVLIAIGMVAVRKGINGRSIPRTIGTFCRWAGVAIATFIALLTIPVAAYWFTIPAPYLLLAFIGIIALGYLAGRAISKLIGRRIGRYGTGIRMAGDIGGRISRMINR